MMMRDGQVCPHGVPPTIDSSDFLSVILSDEGCMAQEIHLDSLDDGWSFLTAMEEDQELLVLWNGFRCVCVVQEIAKDRTAACNLVRTTIKETQAWSDEEWNETIEPRVWNWLCSKHIEKEFGAAPFLQLKRVRIPKGWTIAVDSRTPHGGAAVGSTGAPRFRVHVYAVLRAIDEVITHDDGNTTQDSTVNIRSWEHFLFPIVGWAQRQAAAVFGAFCDE